MKSMAVEPLIFWKSVLIAGLKEMQRMVLAWITLLNYPTTQDR
jgi:hypothetical protein